MHSYLKDVADFHERFEVPMPDQVSLIPHDLMEFRIKFMQEELEEFIEAYEVGNLDGELDALIDLVYVTLGTALVRGFDFDAGWSRVHQANMQKIAVRHSEGEGRHTTDVVKPDGWTPPDLSDLTYIGRTRTGP